MLSWSTILQRIKEELSLPFQALEKTDEEIIDYCKRVCVRKFSTYFPSEGRVVIDSADPNVQVPNRQSEFYIVDELGREVLNVKEAVTSFGHRLVLGHPFIGAFTYDSVPDYALAAERANNLDPFSIYGYTYHFYAPNIIRITPLFHGRLTVIYERMIDTELSDIDPQIEQYFEELCVSMIFMLIGRIRKKYTNIATPFGEINLDADSLFSEGETKYNSLIDMFENKCLTNVIFDRG